MIALAYLMLPTVAKAKCGSGQPPSYDDVSAVMLKQTGCDGTLHARAVRSFDCSYFWVLFWDGEPTEYSQYNLPGQTGFYHLSKTISPVRNILRQDNFFSLSPPDVEVTDTAESVLSVKRCGVITRLQIYNSSRFVEPATARLFADLVRFVSQAPRIRSSAVPGAFKYTLLFDP